MKITVEEVQSDLAFDERTPERWAQVEKEVEGWTDVLPPATPRTAGGTGSGNFGHAGRPGEVGGSSGGLAAFEAQAVENLNQTSRTVKGVSDTTSSVDKPKLVTEGDELVVKTTENFKDALAIAWEAKDKKFASADEVYAFTEEIAGTVSKGLLQPGQDLYRTFDSPQFGYTKFGKIKPEMKQFSAGLLKRLQRNEDPIMTAGWLEKQLSHIHPWSDGVGRTTKVLSAMVLARGGVKLPTYPDSKTYYAEMAKPSWDGYYKGLFK